MKEIKPGTIEYLSEPQYIGAFPVKTEIEIGPSSWHSLAQEEFEKFGSIAIRFPVDINYDGDNIVDYHNIYDGMAVLLRAKTYGFYWIKVKRDRKGYFVKIGGFFSKKIRIVYDENRNAYVFKELI